MQLRRILAGILAASMIICNSATASAISAEATDYVITQADDGTAVQTANEADALTEELPAEDDGAVYDITGDANNEYSEQNEVFFDNCDEVTDYTASLSDYENEGSGTVKVIREDSVAAEERWYASFEEAVANLSQDFEDKQGEYSFLFAEDDRLSKDITMPSFVQKMNLGSASASMLSLDLNGKKVTTAGELTLCHGLEIITGATVNGNPAYGWLYAGNVILEGDSEEASLVGASFQIHDMKVQGNWVLQDRVNLNGGVLLVDNASLSVDNLLSVTKGQVLVQGGELRAKTIALSESKWMCGDGSERNAYVQADEIKVTKAYPGETYGDVTIDVQGCNSRMALGKLEINNGTFHMDEAARASIEFATVKNLVLDHSTELVCDTWNQVSSGEARLGSEAAFWIGTKGTVWNMVLNSEAYLGRGSAALVSLNGTFTASEEESLLHCFVTKEGKEFSEGSLQEALQTPLQNIAVPGADTCLFETAIAAFPVDKLHVFAMVEAGQGQSEPQWSEYDAVYQKENKLLVAGKELTLSVLDAEGEQEISLQSFSAWKDLIAYINALQNPSATYLIRLSSDLDIDQKAELPINAGKVIVESGKGTCDASGQWTMEPVVFTHQGDIVLNTDAEFRNISFRSYSITGNVRSYAYKSVVDTKNRELVLENVSFSNPLSSIKGSAGGQLCLRHISDLQVDTRMTGLDQVTLWDSSLSVNGGLSVNRLLTEGVDSCHVAILGEKSVLEVKKLLTMNCVTQLDCAGALKLTDIISNVAGNGIAVPKANSITITGEVYSENADAMQAVWAEPVYGEAGRLLGYQILPTNDEGENSPIMPNALLIQKKSGDFLNGDVLAVADKVSPVWFAVGSDSEMSFDFRNLAYKTDKNIRCGSVNQAMVVLSCEDSVLGSFDTLQQAFTEIDKLNHPTAEYNILLRDDDWSQKSGKTSDYAFPTKTTKLTISASADQKAELRFSKSFVIKSHVRLENIRLLPESAKGLIVLSNYELEMISSELSQEQFDISGSGINSGSGLILVDSDLKIDGNLTKVKSVFLQDNSSLSIAGKAELGMLKAKGIEAVRFGGTTVIGTVETLEQSSLLLGIAPKVTRNAGGIITGVESQFTVSGEITGDNTLVLFDQQTGEELSVSNPVLADMAQNAGITFAKAPKANTDGILVTSAWGSNGRIYKKNGMLVVKNVLPQVQLSYQTGESGSLRTYVNCYETFGDAIAEINYLKVKRNYEIVFSHSTMQKPILLTMPKADCVDTLILTADDNPVYFEKDITFTSHAVLRDISFVQVAKDKSGQYAEVSDVKAADRKMADPVKVKVNGTYQLAIDGRVSLNVPVLLDGAGKATLVLREGSVFSASAEQNVINEIEGSITGFSMVDVRCDELRLGEYRLAEILKPTVKGPQLSATELRINRYSKVLVGAGNPNSKAGYVSATHLHLYGSLTSSGDMELKNVVLNEQAKLMAGGQKFNITGSLTSLTDKAYLGAVLGTKDKKSVLNISGTISLGTKADYMTVGVYDQDGSPVVLGKQNNSNKLLTTQNGSIDFFRVDAECVNGRELYSASNRKGYILKKSGNDISVLYGEDVRVALYAEGAFYNYYASFNEAVAAIEQLKKTDAAYEIQLIQNVGSKESGETYEKINLPAKAKQLTISSAGEDGLSAVIGSANTGDSRRMALYYNNDLTLGCPTIFRNVTLEPYVRHSINVKGYSLTLDGVATGTSFGKVYGDGKNATVVCRLSQDITIQGDFTGIVKLAVSNEADEQMIIMGKATIGDLMFASPHGSVTVLGSGSTVKNILCADESSGGGNPSGNPGTVSSSENYLDYTGLSITGNIQMQAENRSLILNNVDQNGKVPAGYIANRPMKLLVNDRAKLVNLPVSRMTNVHFSLNGADVTERALWANKAVYLVEEGLTAGVTVRNEDDSELLARCLDMQQAASYINGLSNRTAAYVITFDNHITDTNLTDDKSISAWTFPKKDAAEAVTYQGMRTDDTLPVVSFAGGITLNGAVSFRNMIFQNTADYYITGVRDSDDKKKGISGKSRICMDNVYFETLLSGGKPVGYVKGITGDKKGTELRLVNSTSLMTTEKSSVGKLVLEDSSSWVALGATTIGEVETRNRMAAGFLGAGLKNGVPQMTITGTVNCPMKVKLYDFTTRKEISEQDVSAQEAYENKPLLIARQETAGMFVAFPYAANELTDGQAVFTNREITAYKKPNNYVYNGNISNMEVILTNSKDNNGEITYVPTYGEAVQMINNMGDKNGVYTLKLRATEGNHGVIKTSVSAGNAVFGGFSFPQAGKAKQLIIRSEDEKVEIAYTGKLQPKCDVFFENVVLSEGKTTGKGTAMVFVPQGSVTPDYAGVTVQFGSSAETKAAALPDEFVLGEESGVIPDLVFSSIKVKNSGKQSGVLDISSHMAYVQGTSDIANVWVETIPGSLSKSGLVSKNKITIGNILGEHPADFRIVTSYTDKPWKQALTQLSVTGQVSPCVCVHLWQLAYKVDEDTKEKTIVPLDMEEHSEILYNGLNKPAGWQKLLAAPKQAFQADSLLVGEINLAGNLLLENLSGTDDFYYVKVGGGVYLTKELPSITVMGTGADGELRYAGQFFTWDQAVAEINQIGQNGYEYVIQLGKQLGDDKAPLGSLVMPVKAKKVTLTGEGIVTTATAISLKTDLEVCVPIVAVKKAGQKYYQIPYTLQVGNYHLVLREIPSKEQFGTGWYGPLMKLTGGAKGNVIIYPGNGANEGNGYAGNGTNEGNTYPDNGTKLENILQISNVGNVTLESQSGDQRTSACTYMVEKGISGVGVLTLKDGVTVNTGNKDLNVKNLIMGEHTWSDRFSTTVLAKNVTVSDTLSMTSGRIKAGTNGKGDGKVVLKNIICRDNRNRIEGKQNTKGVSQIQVNGTVAAAGACHMGEPAVTVGLFYSHSATEYVKLTDKMVLLTAPKAASSWFVPLYKEFVEAENRTYINMGPELGTTITVLEGEKPKFISTAEGKETETCWTPVYGVFKSGNTVSYGRLFQTEKYEYTDEDGIVWQCMRRVPTYEVRVWMDTEELVTSETSHSESSDVSYIAFRTFEEAVKAIDSMALKKGNANLNYVIELLQDVEIGNEKGNNVYNGMSLPSRVSNLVINGNGHRIRFSGNIGLRSNVSLINLILAPMKTVKGVANPAKVNLSLGNYRMNWKNTGMYDSFDGQSQIGTINGSAKSGSLVLEPGSYMEADQIFGLYSVVLHSAKLHAKGNVSVGQICYAENTRGVLFVEGNLSVNAVSASADAEAVLIRNAQKTMKVNGRNTVANNPVLLVNSFDSIQAVKTGTPLATGAYLNTADWKVCVAKKADVDDAVDGAMQPYGGYVEKNVLYLGSRITNVDEFDTYGGFEIAAGNDAVDDENAGNTMEYYAGLVGEDVNHIIRVRRDVWMAGFEQESLEYTGFGIYQNVRLYDKDKLLVKNKDYKLVYTNHVNAKGYRDAGAPTMTVLFMGAYSGSKEFTYSILQADIADATMNLQDKTYLYNGKKQEINPAITFNGKTLTKGTHYAVQYAGNSLGAKEGIAKVTYTITGCGNFKGNVAGEYYVVGAKNDFSKAQVTHKEQILFRGEQLSTEELLDDLDISVSLFGQTLDQSCYEVTLVDFDKPGKGYIIVKPGPAMQSSYAGYVKCPCQIVGELDFGSRVSINEDVWQSVMAYSKSLSMAEGMKQNTTGLLMDGEQALLENKDFKVFYSANKNVGVVKATFVGLGKYNGSFSGYFEIIPDAAPFSVTAPSSVAYMKGGVAPEIEVRDSQGVLLQKNIDYTIGYSKNTGVGTAFYRITGKGNYDENQVITGSFEIHQKDLAEDVTLVVKDVPFQNEKEAYRSAPIVYDRNGKRLIAGVDYDENVTYQIVGAGGEEAIPEGAILTPGTIVKVTITGIGHYAGTSAATYKVYDQQYDINSLFVKIDPQRYAGVPVKLTLSDEQGNGSIHVFGSQKDMEDNACELDARSIFEIVSYSDNDSCGIAGVVLRTINGYGGQKAYRFLILQKSLDPVGVSEIQLNYTLLKDMNQGDSIQMEATLLPAEADECDVHWSSNDETIATVDEAGVVTAVGKGYTVLYATVVDVTGKTVKASCGVFVETNVLEVSATPNDNRSDVDAFNSSIDYANRKNSNDNPDDDVILWVPAGIYHVDTTDPYDRIYLQSNVTMVLDENAEIRAMAASSSYYFMMVINNVSNVKVSGGKIVGERHMHKGTAERDGHCMIIMESKNITVENMDISNGWGDGIYISIYSDKYNSAALEEACRNRNIEINNCNIHHNQRNNISIVSGDGITIRGCNVYDHGANEGLCIETNDDRYPVYNVSVYDSVFKGYVKEVAGVVRPASNVTFNNCTFKGTVYNGSCRGMKLVDCVIERDFIEANHSGNGYFNYATLIRTSIRGNHDR